jgi:hypothetical protein
METLRHALSGLYVAGLKIETRWKGINRYMSYPSTTQTLECGGRLVSGGWERQVNKISLIKLSAVC